MYIYISIFIKEGKSNYLTLNVNILFQVVLSAKDIDLKEWNKHREKNIF